MSTGNNILNRLFTQSIFTRLIDSQTEPTYYAVVKKYTEAPESKCNDELIREIYNLMGKTYRNEYFYKNTILNKLLLGRHSPATTTALAEVPVAKSKADFILINGKAIVYEIKTELDSFERLENQIFDYYKAFEHVCVVTCESNYRSIEKRLKDSPVGICLLTKRNTLCTRKEPIADRTNLDLTVMFKILRKKEYESVLKSYYGELPRVTQFNYFSACMNMFAEMGSERAYESFLMELKKRNKIGATEYATVPYELKYLSYFAAERKNYYPKLNAFLHSKFGG